MVQSLSWLLASIKKDTVFFTHFWHGKCYRERQLSRQHPIRFLHFFREQPLGWRATRFGEDVSTSNRLLYSRVYAMPTRMHSPKGGGGKRGEAVANDCFLVDSSQISRRLRRLYGGGKQWPGKAAGPLKMMPSHDYNSEEMIFFFLLFLSCSSVSSWAFRFDTKILRLFQRSSLHVSGRSFSLRSLLVSLAS